MKLFLFITGVLAVGLVLGWFATSGLHFSIRQSSADSPTGQGQDSSKDQTSATAERNSVPDRLRSEPSQMIASDPTEVLTNWEDKVEFILASNDQDDVKARQLLDFFPKLPLEGQIEVAQELGHMLSDDDYSSLAEYMKNPTLPEPLLDTLLAGLSGRTDAIKLPLLLSVAQDDQHPKHEEARDLLEGFLGTDYGTNWDQWSAGVDQRLRNREDTREAVSAGR